LKRVKLIVAYDGTNYSGWQLQNNAITIEEVLNRELSSLLNEDIKVIGASRTDSGVHALGNVCVFDTEARMPAEKISFALNTRLPDDIRIQDSREVRADFHPRHCDTEKTYEYKIYNNRFPNPVMRLYTKFCYYDLNIEAMQEAANYLIGEHDFKSFCSANTSVLTTVRTIKDIKVIKEGSLITIRVTGNGFLYNMVRIISGTLLNVGMGISSVISVKEALEQLDRGAAGPTAEAKGLTLIGINYINEEF